MKWAGHVVRMPEEKAVRKKISSESGRVAHFLWTAANTALAIMIEENL